MDYDFLLANFELRFLDEWNGQTYLMAYCGSFGMLEYEWLRNSCNHLHDSRYQNNLLGTYATFTKLSIFHKVPDLRAIKNIHFLGVKIFLFQKVAFRKLQTGGRKTTNPHVKRNGRKMLISYCIS